jgi:YebC/PmpR family DNA-binding regulatory protein
MGRQWLQKKREINAAKRGKISNKLVREIMVAAKSGMPDPNANARLAVAVEAARKASVPNDTIARAIKKGSGQLGEGVEIELVSYEGFGPCKVPVIVECMTDNRNRTAPEMRTLFRNGQMNVKVGFFFNHVGIIEATHEGTLDIEEVAIEAGAQSVEPVDLAATGQVAAPHLAEGLVGARFLTDATDLDAVTHTLRKGGWTVTVSELGYEAKEHMDLPPDERTKVEDFLHAIDDHDDVHRIYTALK